MEDAEGAINRFGKGSIFLGDLLGCKLFLDFEGFAVFGASTRVPSGVGLERLKIGFFLGVSRCWGVLGVGVDGG